MDTADEVDHDLDRLAERLPEPLRADWVVVPRRLLTQACIVCLVIGSTLSLAIVGLALDVEPLKWTWPLALIGLMLTRRFLPWWRDERSYEQLRRSRPEDGA